MKTIKWYRERAGSYSSRAGYSIERQLIRSGPLSISAVVWHLALDGERIASVNDLASAKAYAELDAASIRTRLERKSSPMDHNAKEASR